MTMMIEMTEVEAQDAEGGGIVAILVALWGAWEALDHSHEIVKGLEDGFGDGCGC
jgi:hypothetical protein